MSRLYDQRQRNALTLRAMLLAGTMLSAPALAQTTLPKGGQVVAGSAAIAQPTTNQMVITQSTQRVAINWQSFNIGAGYGVQFVQPSSQAIALNRVVGLSGPSQILGSLTANGQVYIVNPSGVVFGKGAMVNTGALVATTRDISTSQFMAGGNVTLSGGSTGNGAVINAGTITTDPGGYVVLAGDKVVNKGTINTPGGSTVLAAGDQATVALSNGQLVNVTLNASVANATVKNSGVIKAAGGKVLLSANGAGTVIGGAINLSGTVDVSAALSGSITVDAGPTGTVNATGATLKAVSTAGKGGNITLAGNQVGLFSHTKVNASGTTGGGTVLVGGGAHGSDASVRNASVTVVDSTSTIDASATDKGDGGTVVLWSSSYTGFYGTVTVLGGPNGGSGGWVETSSQSNLQAIGSVQAGAGGSWLLDPSNVNITAGANSGESFNTTNGTWTPSLANATINVAAIDAQLNNGTNVTVTTASGNGSAGNITINANIAKTGGGNATLTLVANGAIVDNGFNISSSTGKLNVNMTANGTVTLANGSAFALNGGTLSIQGGNASNANVGVNIGQTTINAAAATIVGTTTSTFAVNTFGALNASATTLLTINGSGGSNAAVNFGSTVNANALTVTGIASANGTGIVVGANLTAAGNVTLNGTGNGTGSGSGVNIAAALTSNAGTVQINGSGNGSFGVAVTGSVTTLGGDMLIVGSSNSGVGANMAGVLNAAGNLTINGTSQSQRGTRLAGTIVATGTVNISGSSNSGDGIAVPANLALTAANAFWNGSANTSHGINISSTLNAAGTNLTLNGTSTASDGSYYGVNISGTVNVASLTTNGLGNLSATGNVGGTVVSGTVNAGNVTLNGQSNGSFSGVFFTGDIEATGNVLLNGTGNNKYGVNASGTLNAGGTVTINGTSNGTTGVLMSGSLTLAARAGATIVALSNAANAVTFNGTMDSTGTPVLTINGTSMAPDNSSYGVAFNGTANVATLVLNGIGNMTATDNVGGVVFPGTLNATGNVTVNGQSNGSFSGVFFTGCIAAAGNVVLNGSGVAKYGVNASGVLNATGTVTINGTAAQTAGVLLNTSLNIAANAGATIIALSNATNGFFFAGTLNSSATPLLTINGTAANTGGTYYGVAFTGNATVANLAINGVGNLAATNAVGGTTFNGSATASGNVTVNGQSNGSIPAVYFSGGIAACGSIALNGTAGRSIGVNASGTLNAGGPVTIVGGSTANVGVLVASPLTLVGSQGTTINGTNGVELDSSVNASSNLTVDANRITLNNATFSGTSSTVVLQALNSAAAMLVNGSGASFGNVAAVRIGGTNQAAALNMAAALTYAGRGNLSVVTGAANIALNGNINASAGSGSVILSAGNGVALNASQSNGNVTGGDVLVGSVTSLAAGEGGTVVIYGGNANSAAYAPLVASGNTSQTKAYATRAGAGSVCTSSALNLFYRVEPTLTFTLGNATGANVSKTYDGVGVALGYKVSGLIDGDTASVVNLTGNLASSLALNAGQALHAGNYTISRGNATFAAADNYVVGGVTNGSIVIAQANVTVTAASDSKTYDGTVTSNLTPTVNGAVAGDTFNTSNLSQAFNGTHAVGSDGSFLIACGTLSIANSTAGSLMSDYAVTYRTAAGTITARTLTVTPTSDSKVYDGTLTSNLTPTVNGGIAGDTFNTAGLGQIFNNTQVAGTNGTTLYAYGGVTIANSTAGSLLTDYNVTLVTGTGTITPRALTVTATTDTKTYDGTTTSTVLATVTGNIAGDSFTNASLAQVFNSTHALGANGSTLNVAAALTNASLISTVGSSLNISVNIPTNTSTNLTTNISANLSTAPTINLTINASTLADYNITYVTAQGTIAPRTLTVTATTDSKVYDGTISSNLTPTVNGGIAGDTFNTSNLGQLFNSSHVLGANNSTLVASGTVAIATSTAGSLVSDYNIAFANATGTISPKALTVTATTDTKTYDGTTTSTVLATVTGNIAGDSFSNASLAEVYNSSHALGTNNSTLNVAAALTNASFVVTHGCSGLGASCVNAELRTGSYITDYAITYVTAQGTITPKALTVTANSDTKVFDGTASSNATATVCGTIAGDSFSSSALGEVFASPAAGGANNSILLPAAPLTNASFATSTAGSFITDYSITYTAALGTIVPTNGGVNVVPVTIAAQAGGLSSGDVLSLGSWLNSGGQQQNLPSGLALNDNVLHLMFSNSNGQPVIQASWAAFNSNFSGTINLPANVGR